MRFRQVLIALALACGGMVQAAPLNLAQVGADSQWFVHLDVDAMRESSLVQQAYMAGSQQWSEVEMWMGMACDQVGVDPRTDLHGVTLFGTKLGKLEGVALVDAQMRPEAMIDRAKGESGYQSTHYGKREIHSWTDGAKSVSGAFFTPSLLVVARTQEEVQQALDVLDGKRASLAKKSGVTIAAAPQGTMLQAWVQGLANTPLPLKSPAIKKSQALSLLVGENGGEVSVCMRLVMQTPEVAKKVFAVLEGVRSAAELQYEDNPRIMAVVRQVKLSVSDCTVSFELRAGADDVWTQVKHLYAKLRG
jgi:hypothetical protein